MSARGRRGTGPTEHAAAQYAIREAARAAGARAECEVGGRDWRADVLVTRDERRFAFEVEWGSSGSPKAVRERQARYSRDGITGIWLFHKLPGSRPKWHEETPFRADPALPAFGLEPQPGASGQFSVIRHDVTHTLGDFVGGVLSDGLRHSRLVRPGAGPTATINFFSTDCWRCSAPYFVYMLTYPDAAACGVRLMPEGQIGDNEFHPAVVTAARAAQARWTEAPLPFGVVKKSYSQTTHERYPAFTCPRCGALFGQFYYVDQCMEIVYSPKLYALRVPLTLSTDAIRWREEPHWCWRPYCDRSV